MPEGEGDLLDLDDVVMERDLPDLESHPRPRHRVVRMRVGAFGEQAFDRGFWVGYVFGAVLGISLAYLYLRR